MAIGVAGFRPPPCGECARCEAEKKLLSQNSTDNSGFFSPSVMPRMLILKDAKWIVQGENFRPWSEFENAGLSKVQHGSSLQFFQGLY